MRPTRPEAAADRPVHISATAATSIHAASAPNATAGAATVEGTPAAAEGEEPIGLDVQRFARDLGTGRYARRVQQDLPSAEASDVTGIPTISSTDAGTPGPGTRTR